MGERESAAESPGGTEVKGGYLTEEACVKLPWFCLKKHHGGRDEEGTAK